MNNEVPPPEMDINGLYILITETNNKWVPKDLIDDPDACMQFLHQQLEDGTIGQHIGNAFGQWYLYGNTQVCSSTHIAINLFNINCSNDCSIGLKFHVFSDVYMSNILGHINICLSIY